jgi:GTP-binding protein
MEIKTAEFRGSWVKMSDCPTDELPEYAFIGRSNVGKSSLVNMLTKQKYLAKVSGTPGKTQTINYFLMNSEWYIVDLPGYGYARVSQTKRAEWERMIHYFLKNREQLCCIFVLIDAMISPQKIDLEFMAWLGEMRLPFAIVYTKTDRLTARELSKNLTTIRTKILESWEVLPSEFITSAEKGTGKVELLRFIEDINASFK